MQPQQLGSVAARWAVQAEFRPSCPHTGRGTHRTQMALLQATSAGQPLAQAQPGPHPSLTRMKHHRFQFVDVLTNQTAYGFFFPEDTKSGFVFEQLCRTSKCLTGESVM